MEITQVTIPALKQGRSCGGCTACCTVIGVGALHKPVHTACQHQCTSGCAIYDNRPDGCRTYLCEWLAGRLGRDKEAFRPDRLGVIFDLSRNGDGEIIMRCWEVWPGAASSSRARDLIDQLKRRYKNAVWFGIVDRAIARGICPITNPELIEESRQQGAAE